VVLIAGGAGGFIRALLGRDVTWIYPYPDPRGRRRYDFGTPGTVCIGATAGILAWGVYDPQALASSHAITARVIAIALGAGLGGGHIVKVYMDKQLDEAAISDAGKAVARLADPDPMGQSAPIPTQVVVPAPQAAAEPATKASRRSRRHKR